MFNPNKGVVAIIMMLLVVFSVACSSSSAPQSRQEANDNTERNQLRLEQIVPAPQLQDSQERRNLVRRLNAFNSPDKIAYVYIMSGYGDCIAFFTIKGKVSSVNSQLNPTDREIFRGGSSYGNTSTTVTNPELDGSYGPNGDAIFSFLDSGAYMESNMNYVLLDQPLKINCKSQIDTGTGPTNSGPAAPNAPAPSALPSVTPSASPGTRP